MLKRTKKTKKFVCSYLRCKYKHTLLEKTSRFIKFFVKRIDIEDLFWACPLSLPVTFLTNNHVKKIWFAQISPSALSTRDLGMRLSQSLTQQPLSHALSQSTTKSVTSTANKAARESLTQLTIQSGIESVHHYVSHIDSKQSSQRVTYSVNHSVGNWVSPPLCQSHRQQTKQSESH